MDPITTGLGGALIGRALPKPQAGPAATLAVTVASVFPDIDIVFDAFAEDPMAGLTLHRGFTHSYFGVVIMAPLLALVLWRFSKDKNYPRLVGLAALGLVWHIFTDLITSWGTMVYSPWSRERVVWDLVFIIDFVFTGVLLFPHLLIWIYRHRLHAPRRGLLAGGALIAFTALMIQLVSPLYGIPFNAYLFILLSALLAALLLAPGLRGWGFRQPAAAFARIGLAAFAAYIATCAVAHFVALKRVDRFAQANNLEVIAQAALPQPLSPFRWSGLVLTPEGVHQGWFNVLDDPEPRFEFHPSDHNRFVARARALPSVETYLWFARFPVVRYSNSPNRHVVEYTDRRFANPQRRSSPFVFRIVFNDRGQVISNGFLDPFN